jgi:hypothetical protein
MKYSQKQILEESFWDGFKPALTSGVELAKQAAKVAMPETYGNIKNLISKTRQAATDIQLAGMPFDDKMRSWILEQGRYPLDNKFNRVKTYPDGRKHYSVRVAEKGVDKNTGEEVGGRMYRSPHAVVAYDPNEKKFSWIIKPRSDSYQKEKRSDGKTYYRFVNNNSNVDGYDEPIEIVQYNTQTP